MTAHNQDETVIEAQDVVEILDEVVQEPTESPDPSEPQADPLQESLQEAHQYNTQWSTAVAPTIHAAVNTFRATVWGEQALPQWEELTEEQQKTQVNEIYELATFYPNVTAQDYHTRAHADLVSKGFRHGETYDAEAKLSPLCVYDITDAPAFYRMAVELLISSTYALIRGEFGHVYPYSALQIQKQYEELRKQQEESAQEEQETETSDPLSEDVDQDAEAPAEYVAQ